MSGHVGDVPLSYSLVTPARNETEGLRRLAQCLLKQTIKPLQWVVVDDGSTDETHVVASGLAREYDWISVLNSAGAPEFDSGIQQGRRIGRDVHAFKTGLAALTHLPDVVFKLDADVSMAPDYFEGLLGEFVADPTLGIASGTCYEERNGAWSPVHVTGHHVRGASRAYRWHCLQDVLPLEERLGWDGIDELKAAVRGWKTRSFGALPFYHHRVIGERDGARRKAWAGQGDAAYYLGYRFPYLILRALHWAREEPSALAMILGYVTAALKREPRYEDGAVREFLRSQQTLRALPVRAREALGRRRD